MIEFPTIETYRDVPIHDFQPRDRIERVVRPAIDRVLDGLADSGALVFYASNAAHPPEARLLAAAKLAAGNQMRSIAHVRRLRGQPSLEAILAGVADFYWADPTRFCSLLDPGSDAAPLRPPREQRRLLTALAAVRPELAER